MKVRVNCQFSSGLKVDCEAGTMYILDNWNHDLILATLDGTMRRPLMHGIDSPTGMDFDRHLG